MKTLLLITLLFFSQATAMKPNDLALMKGKKWNGTLTYLDYGTKKLVSVATELMVTDKAPGVYNWISTYPQEPDHNSTDELVISQDGKLFDGEEVMERVATDGSLRFVTRKAGSDDHKPAHFRFTYLITKTTFLRKKEVCFDGENAWFLRNELNLKTN